MIDWPELMVPTVTPDRTFLERLYETGWVDDRIFYFSEGKECDFVVQHHDSISQLVQVCWELTDENYERELGGLLAASEYTGCKNCKVITSACEDSFEYHGLTVQVEPVWKENFALNHRL